MAFTSNSGGGPMAEINVTPLVDVMLVLLIIFMITAPLMSHKIRIDLPQANPNVQEQNPPEPIDLAVKESGEIFWNDELVTEAMLQAQLRVAAQKNPQPELQIRADKETKYQLIATVMANAKSAGMVKIGFITTSAGSARSKRRLLKRGFDGAAAMQRRFCLCAPDRAIVPPLPLAGEGWGEGIRSEARRLLVRDGSPNLERPHPALSRKRERGKHSLPRARARVTRRESRDSCGW